VVQSTQHRPSDHLPDTLHLTRLGRVAVQRLAVPAPGLGPSLADRRCPTVARDAGRGGGTARHVLLGGQIRHELTHPGEDSLTAVYQGRPVHELGRRTVAAPRGGYGVFGRDRGRVVIIWASYGHTKNSIASDRLVLWLLVFHGSRNQN